LGEDQCRSAREPPFIKSFTAKLAKHFSANQMALSVEEVVDGGPDILLPVRAAIIPLFSIFTGLHLLLGNG